MEVKCLGNTLINNVSAVVYVSSPFLSLLKGFSLLGSTNAVAM